MAKYIIDPTHSDISFKVKNMMISSVKGAFNNYEASLKAEQEDFSDAIFNCEIDVTSLYTGIEDRDRHLISEEFFDCQQYPKIKFSSTSISTFSSEQHFEYAIDGDLQIKDDTRSIKLTGSYDGVTLDKCGQEKYCFKLKGNIKRLRWFLDFMSKNSRNMLIDNDVELLLDMQFFKLEE